MDPPDFGNCNMYLGIGMKVYVLGFGAYMLLGLGFMYMALGNMNLGSVFGSMGQSV